MKILPLTVLLFAFLFQPVLFAVETLHPDEEESQLDKSLYTKQKTTIERKKAAKSTQKGHSMGTRGVTDKSTVLKYDVVDSFHVKWDKDKDGTLGENEPKGQDLDHDGNIGENENGRENVTKAQTVTLLNNMSLGSNLSSFQAAGQTHRKSVFVEEEPKKKAADEQAAAAPSAPVKKGKVLVG